MKRTRPTVRELNARRLWKIEIAQEISLGVAFVALWYAMLLFL